MSADLTTWNPARIRSRILRWDPPGDRDWDEPHPVGWLVRVWKSSHDEELSLACAENILDEERRVRAGVISFFNWVFDPEWHTPDGGRLLDAAMNYKELFQGVRDPWRPHDRVDLYEELTHVLAKRVRSDEPQVLTFLQAELMRPRPQASDRRQASDRGVRQGILSGLMWTPARTWVLEHVRDLVQIDPEFLEPILFALARSQQESLFRQVVDLASDVMGRDALLRYAKTRLRKAWDGWHLELSPDTVMEQLRQKQE